MAGLQSRAPPCLLPGRRPGDHRRGPDNVRAAPRLVRSTLTTAMSAPSPAGNTPTDIANCDHEPIRIPGAIQPHGFLVAFDDEHLVEYASANVREFLDRDPGSLMGQNITA